jgi:hypothetical protein
MAIHIVCLYGMVIDKPHRREDNLWCASSLHKMLMVGPGKAGEIW